MRRWFMVISCCFEAGVMECWSIGIGVEYIRFFSSNTPSLQYSGEEEVSQSDNAGLLV
jgi:hypothetical protein